MVEYVPFHKNCKQMTVVGESDITPEGVGCKINDYLIVLYYPCNSAEEMKEIFDNGFKLMDGKLGKGVYMYRKYKDAIEINQNFIVFTRVTKGNHKQININEIDTFDSNEIDLVTLIDGDKIIDCVYNIASIDIIAFLEFEQ